VDRLPDGTKELTLDAMLVIDGDKTTVGTPLVKGVAVKAKVVDEEGSKGRQAPHHPLQSQKARPQRNGPPAKVQPDPSSLNRQITKIPAR